MNQRKGTYRLARCLVDAWTQTGQGVGDLLTAYKSLRPDTTFKREWIQSALKFSAKYYDDLEPLVKCICQHLDWKFDGRYLLDPESAEPDPPGGSSASPTQSSSRTKTPERDLPLAISDLTFVMTDLEGSTRMWEANDSATMNEALSQHDSIADTIAAEFNGRRVKERGAGDSLFLVFERSLDAVKFAHKFQVAINTASWPGDLNLVVRIAIHSGPTTLRENDYYGTTINRLARILSLAFGGQVLVSEASCLLAQPELESPFKLAVLGTYRLRDLREPEVLAQLEGPDLRGDFPELKGLDQSRHNLPIQLTELIGREDDVEQLQQLMAVRPWVTAVGAPGVGTTRVALQAAADSLERFEGGAWFVDLSIVEPQREAICAQILTELPISEDPKVAIEDQVFNFLNNSKCLLVLEGCDRLEAALVPLINRWLKTQSSVLATAREPLKDANEKVFTVHTLACPTKTDRDLSQVRSYPSVELFADRAKAVKSDFEVNKENYKLVGEICSKLAGLPLAIILLAPRTKSLSLAQILQNVDNIRIYASGNQESDARKRTLEASINSSFEGLLVEEKLFFIGSSNFAGGWSLDAALALCDEINAYPPEGLGPVDYLDAFGLLDRLAEKNMIVADTLNTADARYSLLRPMRQFALDRLRQLGLDDRLAEFHAKHYVAVAEKAEPRITAGNADAVLPGLVLDRENLEQAFEWLDQRNRSAERLKLAASLAYFWHLTDALSHGLRRLESALSSSDMADPRMHAIALNGAGVLAWRLGRLPLAVTYFSKAVAEFEKLGLKARLSGALSNLGLVQTQIGDDPEIALKNLMAGYEIRREMQDEPGMFKSLNNLGILYWRERKPDLARNAWEQALGIARGQRDVRSQAEVNQNLGLVELDSKQYESAIERFTDAKKIFLERDMRSYVAPTLINIGICRSRLKQFDEALAEFERAIRISEELEDQVTAAEAKLELGNALIELGKHTQGCDQLADVFRLGASIGKADFRVRALVIAARSHQARGRSEAATKLVLLAVHELTTSRNALPQDEEPQLMQLLSSLKIEGKTGEPMDSIQAASMIQAH